MLTKKVKNRMLFLSFVIATSIFGIYFIIITLNSNLLYFRTPTDISENINLQIGKQMRLGGMVKKNSIKSNKNEIQFIITDFENEILISYSGTVPNLFAEGKGVVAEGKLSDKNFFKADRILAKHDENYMPPEIKEIIKKNAK